MKYLNEYTVRIMKSGDTHFEVKKVPILAENETWIVLDTEHYEKVTKSKTFDFIHSRVEHHKIYKKDNETGHFENDPLFGNGVFYKLHTRKTKRPATIRKEIKAFLDEKFGYLTNIDLSFIK
jgi:hypothetical protein